MSLTKSWAYGVRALLLLAETWGDEKHRWQSTELAEQAGLPASFTSKLLSSLASAGLIDSARGRGGGMRLARDPRELRLVEVASALGEEWMDEDLPEGFEEAPEAVQQAMQRSWSPYARGTREFLVETTIADLRRQLPQS